MARLPKPRDPEGRTLCNGCKEWKHDSEYPKTLDGRPNGRCYKCRAAEQRLRDAPKLHRRRIESAHDHAIEYIIWLEFVKNPDELSDTDFRVWLHLKKVPHKFPSSDTSHSS